MADIHSQARGVLRILAALAFVAAGANHFVRGDFYQRMIPPAFPAPRLLVVVSGICEILGGVGLLIHPLRAAAGWGLIALLIAVFPANLYMAIHAERFADLPLPAWSYWARLPVQLVLILWVWCVS